MDRKRNLTEVLVTSLAGGLLGLLLAFAFRRPWTVGWAVRETTAPTTVDLRNGAQTAPARNANGNAQAVPLLVVPVDKLQLVPGLEGYDPWKFREIVSVKDIFLQEPRNVPWAEPVEHFLREDLSLIVKKRYPDVSLSQVECRTTICKISWGETKQKAEDVGLVMISSLSSLASLGGRENALFVSLVGGDFFGNEPLNNPSATIRKIAEVRQKMADLKAHGRMHDVVNIVPGPVTGRKP